MMFKEKATSGRPEPFASILYAEPGALGLTCNILSAVTVAIENIADGSDEVIPRIISGTHLILIGGFLQLTAGFLSFRRNDHLTATSFTVFAALWANQGILNILSATESFSEFPKAVLPGIVGFMVVTIILLTCSLFVNYIMPPVLAAMLLTLIFECVGQFYVWGKRVAAAFELVIAISAIYAVVVMTTKGISQRYILPGFGNAPIDPLLIQTKSVGKKKNEKRKNTKYAEPMGMGYIGSIVPAVVLCFYHFGYITDFRPAMPSLLCGFLCHILASYYSFLRKDSFHTFQFTAYLIFWTARTVTPFLQSIGVDELNENLLSDFGSWGLVLIMILITVVSSSQNLVLFIYNLFLTTTVILSVEHIPKDTRNYTFGVSSAVIVVITIYLAIASLLNSIAEKPIVFIGPEVVSSEKFKALLKRCQRHNNEETEPTNADDAESRESHTDVLIVDGVMFIANCVAAVSLSPTDVTGITQTVSVLLVAGVIVNIYCARLAYVAGSLARTFNALVLAGIWATWTLTAFDGIEMESVRPAAISVMSLQALSVIMSCTFSLLWLIVSILMLVNIMACVFTVFAVEATYMILVTSLLAGVVCLYGSFAILFNTLVGDDIIPTGRPILKIKEAEKPALPCPVFASRKASDLLACAKLLDQGVVVGIPTDTVYALAASCKHPESINAIYHIKGRPPEKPICLCISSLDQLKTANPPFSPLLWKFMDLCYPGGITCTVKKGDWLKSLGVGDSIDYIGKKDSVAIRVPDSSVLSYLISVSGPVALTSANPSGEPDSLHHDMVLTGLGHKLAGVVCDDESNELKPSTVVNCLDIENGVISYFRIGCVPQDKVDALFEQAKEELNSP